MWLVGMDTDRRCQLFITGSGPMQFGTPTGGVRNLRIWLVFGLPSGRTATPKVFQVSLYKCLDRNFADVAYDPLAFFPENRFIPVFRRRRKRLI
ncbi:MAG: hypothetical protein AMJ54_02210 [Deltaproteobacteria bacterium SG8_13]|nr:MAG: hypothetical protein AMJ54_02210 [Deltaproteobacteria bacterium SG8_13]